MLSTFMVADSVEIITCHQDEEQARHLTLRSVHGKYLIRLLDKADASVRPLVPHGTIFKLKVRPSVDMPDVAQTAARWIVIPECEVSVTVDNGKPNRLGCTTPTESLLALLGSRGHPSAGG